MHTSTQTAREGLGGLHPRCGWGSLRITPQTPPPPPLRPAQRATSSVGRVAQSQAVDEDPAEEVLDEDELDEEALDEDELDELELYRPTPPTRTWPRKKPPSRTLAMAAPLRMKPAASCVTCRGADS